MTADIASVEVTLDGPVRPRRWELRLGAGLIGAVVVACVLIPLMSSTDPNAFVAKPLQPPFKAVSDPAARIAQLQSGQLDFADQLSPNQLAQLPDDIEVTLSGAVAGNQMLVMNNRENSVLSDVRIRRALALAVDRNQLNEIAWDGRNKVSLGLFGSGSPYTEEWFSPEADPDGAKAMLAGTECESGCTLKFVGNAGQQIYRDMSLIVQQNLQAVGIKVDIQDVDEGTQAEMLTEGDFDIAIRGTYDTVLDGFLDYAIGPSLVGFRTGYESEAMNQLIDEVHTSAGSERDAAIHRLNDQFLEDLPWAPLLDFSQLSASRVSTDRFSVGAGFFYNVG